MCEVAVMHRWLLKSKKTTVIVVFVILHFGSDLLRVCALNFSVLFFIPATASFLSFFSPRWFVKGRCLKALWGIILNL